MNVIIECINGVTRVRDADTGKALPNLVSVKFEHASVDENPVITVGFIPDREDFGEHVATEKKGTGLFAAIKSVLHDTPSMDAQEQETTP